MTRVVVSSRAAMQLREIYQYSEAQWGHQKAEEYVTQLEKRFVELGENKLLGRVRLELGGGYRSLTEGRHVIFYRAGEGKVVVVAVLHGNMDVGKRISDEKTKRKDKKNRKASPGKKR